MIHSLLMHTYDILQVYQLSNMYVKTYNVVEKDYEEQENKCLTRQLNRNKLKGLVLNTELRIITP